MSKLELELAMTPQLIRKLKELWKEDGGELTLEQYVQKIFEEDLKKMSVV